MLKFDKPLVLFAFCMSFLFVFFSHMFTWENSIKALPLNKQDKSALESIVDKKYLDSAEFLSVSTKTSKFENARFSVWGNHPLLVSLNSYGENFTELINYERKDKPQWHRQESHDNFFLEQMNPRELLVQETMHPPTESVALHEEEGVNKDKGLRLDFIFVIAFSVFPMLIYFLMKKNNISLNKVTILNFVVLAIFFFDYIGLVSLYFGWNQYRYDTGVQDKSILFQVFLCTSWSIFIIVSSYACCKHYIGKISYNFGSYRYREFTRLEETLVYVLLLVSLIFLFLYIQKVPKIALWETLTKGAKMGALARSKMGNDFSGKYHWYNLMIHDLLNLITFAFFANWLIVKRWAKCSAFLFTFLCAIYTSTMAIEKSRFFLLTIGLLFVYLTLKKEGKIFTTAFLKMFFILLALSFLFYIYFMGSNNLVATVLAVFSRAFTGEIQPAYHYLEFFPAHHDFLWGQSFPNPGEILPFKHYRLPVEIMNWRFPSVAEQGMVGSMPTIFWGELYANFGMFGVIIGPFFVGSGLYAVDFFVNKLENTPLKVGFYAWLILHYMNLSISGIGGFICDFYLVAVSFFVCFVCLMPKILMYIKQKMQFAT